MNEALMALFSGSLGSVAGWTATLRESAPLLVTGLAVALAFRGGVWNIGAEGQLLAGALCATAVATRLLRRRAGAGAAARGRCSPGPSAARSSARWRGCCARRAASPR